MDSAAIGSTKWRVSAGGRIAGVVLLVGWIGLAVGISVGGNAAAIVIWVATVPLAAGVWQWAFVPYVLLGATEVTIQNRSSKVSVNYSQIRQVRAGYYGLTFILADGRRITAWAVQKSNWARWFRTPARADAVVDAITARLGSTERPSP